MHRYLAVFAVLAALACNSPVAVGGTLDVSVAPTGLRIVNNSGAPAYFFAVERETAARINWAPCVDPEQCREVAVGAETTVPYTAVAGWAPGAHEAIVYWWHLVPETGDTFHADSIRALVVSLSAPSDTVRVTGTVRHYDLEGGFWAVRGDDGTTYDPKNGLPSDCQTDGQRVLLEARLTHDYGIHQVGPIVEIISLQRI